MEDPDDHPVERYWQGSTRYDLDAKETLKDGAVVTARQYLIEAKKPDRYFLRRLQRREYYSLAERWDSERMVTCTDAVRIGIEKCEGMKLEGAASGRLTEADLTKLDDSGVLIKLGVSVINSSAPLRADEGK